MSNVLLGVRTLSREFWWRIDPRLVWGAAFPNKFHINCVCFFWKSLNFECLHAQNVFFCHNWKIVWKQHQKLDPEKIAVSDLHRPVLGLTKGCWVWTVMSGSLFYVHYVCFCNLDDLEHCVQVFSAMIYNQCFKPQQQWDKRPISCQNLTIYIQNF